MIEERVERFKCSPEFHPYLVKVLERLPEDVLKQKILDGSWLEIVSFNPDTYGHCFRLDFPTSHLIVLNEAILEHDLSRKFFTRLPMNWVIWLQGVEKPAFGKKRPRTW